MNRMIGFLMILISLSGYAVHIESNHQCYDGQVINGTTGTPLGGFGCGGVKFNANDGTFAAMTQPPADAYDFEPVKDARLSLSVMRDGKIEKQERLKAALDNDGHAKDDAIWPLHRVDFGIVNSVKVCMTGISPLDSENYDNMHLPYALYEVTLTNIGSSRATVDFVFEWPGYEQEWNVATNAPSSPIDLKPGKTKTLRYVLAWYQRKDSELGYYMNLYDHPRDIANHGLKVFDRLKQNAEQLVDGMRASSLPSWLVNQTLNTLSSVVINGMYKRDGRTAFAEGQWTCFGTMDQMWQARQIICQLLPRYAWQELDFWARTQMRNGQIHHDCNFENKAKDKARRSRLVGWDDTEHDDYRDIQRWVDLNSAFIISVFEIYRATADREHFLRLWPNVKRAAQRMLDQVAAYGNKDYPYTFTDSQNSYDHGGDPDPYNASLSAVAYKLMSMLADETGETALADNYRQAFEHVRTSFHNRYIRDRQPITGMHCESVFAGQWLALHLGLGEIWSKEDTDYVLSQLDGYYHPLQQGLGFPKGTYDEWTPYILTHYGGLLLLTGHSEAWLAMQEDAYHRQYDDRDRVFDHRLNILPKPEKPKLTATNIKSKGQYISIPAIWRNYYDLIGFRRDARTHELWLTPIVEMTGAMFLSPETNGTISQQQRDSMREITFRPQHPINVSTLYLTDDFTGNISVTINGKPYHAKRIGSGHATQLAIHFDGKVTKKGLTIKVTTK